MGQKSSLPQPASSVSQVLKRDTCQSRARFHEQEVLVSGVEQSHQSGGEGLSETRRTSGGPCRALFAEYTSLRHRLLWRDEGRRHHRQKLLATRCRKGP